MITVYHPTLSCVAVEVGVRGGFRNFLWGGTLEKIGKNDVRSHRPREKLMICLMF